MNHAELSVAEESTEVRKGYCCNCGWWREELLEGFCTCCLLGFCVDETLEASWEVH